jgi:hypothetical protein
MFKPAVKTTEFWLVVVGILITTVYPMVLEHYPNLPEIWIVVIDGLIAVYVGARSYIKGQAVK